MEEFPPSVHLRDVLRHFLFVLTGLAVVAPAPAATFSSGPNQVALIELFTSEGCSSCPPAERWLGELRDDVRLWKKFVPIAWHVNYWDRLGWRDKFSSREFTARQYAYGKLWRADNVYTPCFVRDGAEWRDRDLGSGDDRAPAGALVAEWETMGEVRVSFDPIGKAARGDFDVHVALLGGGIESDVRAGENAGRTLAHEFVVLAFRNAPLAKAAEGTLLEGKVTITAKDAPTVPRRALAVWITRRGELAPLQATGGWLD